MRGRREGGREDVKKRREEKFAPLKRCAGPVRAISFCSVKRTTYDTILEDEGRCSMVSSIFPVGESDGALVVPCV
jgi:hypothetical protein